MRAGIDAQIKTPLIAQQAVSLKVAEQLAAFATAATAPQLAALAGVAKMRAGIDAQIKTPLIAQQAVSLKVAEQLAALPQPPRPRG
jgi:hypothetical protein